MPWPWCSALLGVAVMAWLGLGDYAWTDFDTELTPAFGRLVHGDVAGFLGQLPAYGGSVVLRAPFAAAAALLGGGDLAIFRAVSIPCLVAAAWLAVALVGRMRERGRSTGVRALVLGLCVVNPVTLRALQIGHPEEILCAVFAIAAVLVARDRRPLLAGLLLGLAIATKSWAVLAIGPVLLALASRRLLALSIAAVVTAAVLAPIAVFGAHAALVGGAATTGGTIFKAQQLWWFLGDASHVVIGVNGLPKPAGFRAPPAWLSPLAHPLIAFLVVPLSALWARRRGWAPWVDGEQVLALLALLLLARCVLDPWNNVYYAVPFLLALLAWEALCETERPPVLALAATALVWVTFERVPAMVGPDAQCVLYLAWSLPLGAWLAREAFAPARRVRAARATRGAYA